MFHNHIRHLSSLSLCPCIWSVPHTILTYFRPTCLVASDSCIRSESVLLVEPRNMRMDKLYFRTEYDVVHATGDATKLISLETFVLRSLLYRQIQC